MESTQAGNGHKKCRNFLIPIFAQYLSFHKLKNKCFSEAKLTSSEEVLFFLNGDAMVSNFRKYQEDLEKLIKMGNELYDSMCLEFASEEAKKGYLKHLSKLKKSPENLKKYLKDLPSFRFDYQIWYSEALAVLKQMLPDRVENFTKQYEKPKVKRKDITFENYVIEDALTGLQVTHGTKVIADASAAISKFGQQLYIIKSIQQRFESSLFDMKQLVQADIFDSELESARELLKKGFVRGSAVVGGVVLEKHLAQACTNHNINVPGKNPTISNYNNKLRDGGVYETPTWRRINFLADIRNQCCHKSKKEPKKEDVEDLIDGVEKIIKTIF